MVVRKNLFPQDLDNDPVEEPKPEIKNPVQMKNIKTKDILMKGVEMKSVIIFPVKMKDVEML